MNWTDPNMMPCQCGSRHVTEISPAELPYIEWRCAQCGELLGGVFNDLDERESPGPPEFVMSALQWQRKWPAAFWARLVRRVSAREVTINPHQFAEKLARFIPGASDQKAPGQPAGPRGISSLAEFETLLQQVMSWLEKKYPTVPKWRIVNAMYRLNQMPRPQRQGQVSTINTGDRPSQAAKQWAYRCERAFGIDLNVVIALIRRELHDG
jgi:hypothetical protein